MKTLAGMLGLVALGAVGCARMTPRLFAPLQPDGWSAQPVYMANRFASDADLDSDTRMPVGDEGYYLYVLTRAGDWDYRSTKAYLWSHWRQPWGHAWLILQSPTNTLEFGLNGNFGLEMPKYGDGVSQRLRDGDPNPISYLWVLMSDGELEFGNGDRTPTFVWRMPITSQRHQRIHRHVMQWNYDRIGVRTNNCVDLATEAAELAGIHLVRRMRLTLPSEITMLRKTVRIWTDPQYRILEYSTPDVLEADLRHLARFGIGQDATDWYLASDMAAPKWKDSGQAGGRRGARAEDGR